MKGEHKNIKNTHTIAVFVKKKFKKIENTQLYIHELTDETHTHT